MSIFDLFTKSEARLQGRYLWWWTAVSQSLCSGRRGDFMSAWFDNVSCYRQ